MVEMDFAQLPFSLLDEASRQDLAAAIEMAWFERGARVLEAGAPVAFVHVVDKGVVLELDPALPAGADRLAVYGSGDVFGALGVLNGQSRYRFVTEEESLCSLIPASVFLELCERQPQFAAYFRQRLEAKNRLLAERREGGVTLAGFMLARVDQCMRQPLLLPEQGSIRAAVVALEANNAESLLVVRGERVGMITKTDLLHGLVHEGLAPESPALALATFELVAVPPEEHLFSALVRMTRHGVTRVVVMDGHTARGVVELPDVLSFFSSRSYVVGLEVEEADDLDALARASARLPELVQALMAQGVKMRFLMDLMAALNGRIITKAFEFVMPEAQRDQACLMVLGSEGRGEQILKTDQDNALILGDGDWPQREEHLARFTDTLLRLGYPRCRGNIMVSNPRWVGTLEQWRRRVGWWAGRGDEDAMIKLAALLDAQPAAGRLEQVEMLRDALFRRCSGDQILLSRFARPVLQFSTPLNWFGALKKQEQGIDIKKAGLFPVIHGVRSMSLELRIATTSTFGRLERLAASGELAPGFAEELGEAMALFAELRLRQQLLCLEGDQPAVGHNHILVQRLSTLERDLLRESLRVVNEFKKRLTRRFHLEY